MRGGGSAAPTWTATLLQLRWRSGPREGRRRLKKELRIGFSPHAVRDATDELAAGAPGRAPPLRDVVRKSAEWFIVEVCHTCT
jgi:hypothetical protein